MSPATKLDFSEGPHDQLATQIFQSVLHMGVLRRGPFARQIGSRRLALKVTPCAKVHRNEQKSP